LAAVPDPRRQCKNLRHPLVDVLVVGFCGVLCGCEDFVELETFGRKKEDFFRRFLELPEGTPSHDTFRRAFQAVCPQALQRCLIQWLQAIRQPAPPPAGEVIAIDGKTLRRTFDRARSSGPPHLVGAWATANGLTLGQVTAGAKSNEITAIPKLIEMDGRVAALVSLIKAAHLSLFHLLGYRYALKAAGLSVGHDVLGDFYLANRDKGKEGVRAAARTYFRQYIHMVRPIDRVEGTPPRGTVDDRAVNVCLGSSGRPFGLVVCVRSGPLLHAVLMPAFEHHESAAAYHGFLNNDNEALRLCDCEYDPTSICWRGTDQVVEAQWPKHHESFELD
jgi:hypothetical protein